MNDNNDNLCAICLETLDSKETLKLDNCIHTFHEDCFDKNKIITCPMCRAPVKSEIYSLCRSSVYYEPVDMNNLIIMPSSINYMIAFNNLGLRPDDPRYIKRLRYSN